MIGEFAALGAALAWAVASLIFRSLGAAATPVLLNFYKGVLATLLFAGVLAWRGDLWQGVEPYALALLTLSGVIGIGVGDTAFFASLNRLGARRTVLMAETLAPPITTLIAFWTLAEVLPLGAFLGMALTIAGVAWVVAERTVATPLESSRIRSGIGYGVFAALCQALGAVISRAALTQTEVGPLWSSWIRIGGSLLFLVPCLLLTRQPFVVEVARGRRIWVALGAATLIGTCLGIFLQQIALQHTSAGIVQTLIATSSLFVLPLVALRGESVSQRAVAGALLAVVGVAILFAVQ